MKIEKQLKKQVVFILSEVRSGSTWLSYVLGSHTGAVHLGEYYRPFTMQNHVACRLCEGNGKKECDYLYGIEEIAKEDAFNFAFDRFQGDMLVDASKQLTWLNVFTDSDDFEIKIIHLLRDPRAWFASQKRRDKGLSIDRAIKSWIKTNEDITKALEEASLSFVTAFYDELCINPHHYFEKSICGYLGKSFESSALEYWKKSHHGLGGNGAALNNLIDCPQGQVKTGGDKFYVENIRKLFYDKRWLTELSATERDLIESMPMVNEYLQSHARSFSLFDSLLETLKELTGHPS